MDFDQKTIDSIQIQIQSLYCKANINTLLIKGSPNQISTHSTARHNSVSPLSLTQSPLCFMNTGRARPASRTQDPTDTFTSDMPCPERDETGFQVSQAYITFMIHAKYVLQVIAKIKIHILYGLFAS